MDNNPQGIRYIDATSSISNPSCINTVSSTPALSTASHPAQNNDNYDHNDHTNDGFVTNEKFKTNNIGHVVNFSPINTLNVNNHVINSTNIHNIDKVQTNLIPDIQPSDVNRANLAQEKIESSFNNNHTGHFPSSSPTIDPNFQPSHHHQHNDFIQQSLHQQQQQQQIQLMQQQQLMNNNDNINKNMHFMPNHQQYQQKSPQTQLTTIQPIQQNSLQTPYSSNKSSNNNYYDNTLSPSIPFQSIGGNNNNNTNAIFNSHSNNNNNHNNNNHIHNMNNNNQIYYNNSNNTTTINHDIDQGTFISSPSFQQQQQQQQQQLLQQQLHQQQQQQQLQLQNPSLWHDSPANIDDLDPHLPSLYRDTYLLNMASPSVDTVIFRRPQNSKNQPQNGDKEYNIFEDTNRFQMRRTRAVLESYGYKQCSYDDLTRCSRLFIGQIPPNQDLKEFYFMLSCYGMVEEVVFLRDRVTASHTGAAFCTFHNVHAARRAVVDLDGQVKLDGAKQHLVVRLSPRHRTERRVEEGNDSPFTKIFFSAIPQNTSIIELLNLFSQFDAAPRMVLYQREPNTQYNYAIIAIRGTLVRKIVDFFHGFIFPGSDTPSIVCELWTCASVVQLTTGKNSFISTTIEKVNETNNPYHTPARSETICRVDSYERNNIVDIGIDLSKHGNDAGSSHALTSSSGTIVMSVNGDNNQNIHNTSTQQHIGLYDTTISGRCGSGSTGYGGDYAFNPNDKISLLSRRSSLTPSVLGTNIVPNPPKNLYMLHTPTPGDFHSVLSRQNGIHQPRYVLKLPNSQTPMMLAAIAHRHTLIAAGFNIFAHALTNGHGKNNILNQRHWAAVQSSQQLQLPQQQQQQFQPQQINNNNNHPLQQPILIQPTAGNMIMNSRNNVNAINFDNVINNSTNNMMMNFNNNAIINNSINTTGNLNNHINAHNVINTNTTGNLSLHTPIHHINSNDSHNQLQIQQQPTQPQYYSSLQPTMSSSYQIPPQNISPLPPSPNIELNNHHPRNNLNPSFLPVNFNQNGNGTNHNDVINITNQTEHSGDHLTNDEIVNRMARLSITRHTSAQNSPGKRTNNNSTTSPPSQVNATSHINHSRSNTTQVYAPNATAPAQRRHLSNQSSNGDNAQCIDPSSSPSIKSKNRSCAVDHHDDGDDENIVNNNNVHVVTPVGINPTHVTPGSIGTTMQLRNSTTSNGRNNHVNHTFSSHNDTISTSNSVNDGEISPANHTSTSPQLNSQTGFIPVTNDTGDLTAHTTIAPLSNNHSPTIMSTSHNDDSENGDKTKPGPYDQKIQDDRVLHNSKNSYCNGENQQRILVKNSTPFIPQQLQSNFQPTQQFQQEQSNSLYYHSPHIDVGSIVAKNMVQNNTHNGNALQYLNNTNVYNTQPTYRPVQNINPHQSQYQNHYDNKANFTPMTNNGPQNLNFHDAEQYNSPIKNDTSYQNNNYNNNYNRSNPILNTDSITNNYDPSSGYNTSNYNNTYYSRSVNAQDDQSFTQSRNQTNKNQHYVNNNNRNEQYYTSYNNNRNKY